VSVRVPPRLLLLVALAVLSACSTTHLTTSATPQPTPDPPVDFVVLAKTRYALTNPSDAGGASYGGVTAFVVTVALLGQPHDLHVPLACWNAAAVGEVMPQNVQGAACR
jgi:hypothetical protein